MPHRAIVLHVAHGRNVSDRVAKTNCLHTETHHGKSLRKNGGWLVRFRFLGKEFKRSLKTHQQADAEAGQLAVEWTIHRLATGQLQLPPEVDAGDFIVSGGLLQTPLRSPGPAAEQQSYEQSLPLVTTGRINK